MHCFCLTKLLASSHKSHNASDKYSTMHHFVTEMGTHEHIAVTKMCIVVYVDQYIYTIKINLVEKALQLKMVITFMCQSCSRISLAICCFNWSFLVNIDPDVNDREQIGTRKQINYPLYSKKTCLEYLTVCRHLYIYIHILEQKV